MTDAIPVSTPMESGTKLVLPDINEEKPELPYQQLIGSLMYIAIGTRPDIAHTVSVLSQFNAHYGEVHWRAAKRVLRYLKASKDKRLIFKKTGDMIGYADADYGSNLVDRRSYTGYVFQMSGSSVSWESRKQRTVAQSTTEAEYMALNLLVIEEAISKAGPVEAFIHHMTYDYHSGNNLRRVTPQF
ncbi:uncharacterized protein LOC135077861 [Ostrinia nubilalis]|uniref:uncharacterized protein LOC135077861 n=1 Tax=Ostrinia nubilalis TaxID=29057 RepID=UPI0030824877